MPCPAQVILRDDRGYFIEYVHIRTGSARVPAGTRVRAGDILCEVRSIQRREAPLNRQQAEVLCAARYVMWSDIG